MKKTRAILLILLAALAVGATAAYYYGREWIEEALLHAAAERGLEAAFEVEAVGPGGITLARIDFGKTFPLAIDRVTVGYSLPDLLEGRLRDLSADEMIVRIGKREILARDARATFSPSPQGAWRGEWSVASVEMAGLPLELPALAGSGAFAVEDGGVEAEGTFASADRNVRAEFEVDYDTGKPEQSALTVKEAHLPWNEGALSTRNAVIPLSEGRQAAATVEAQAVSLGLLLHRLTDGRAQATGTVSGRVPLRIGGDGTFTVSGGRLTADAPGTISLQPGALPGGGDQIRIVTDVLADFHYRALAMTIDSDKDGKLSLLLSVEGSNPAVYEGRAVKLNVHLTGDVLSLLQQSIMPLNDPGQFLERE